MDYQKPVLIVPLLTHSHPPQVCDQLFSYCLDIVIQSVALRKIRDLFCLVGKVWDKGKGQLEVSQLYRFCKVLFLSF